MNYFSCSTFINLKTYSTLTFPVITKSKLELSQSHTSTPPPHQRRISFAMITHALSTLTLFPKLYLEEMIFYDRKFQTKHLNEYGLNDITLGPAYTFYTQPCQKFLQILLSGKCDLTLRCGPPRP